MTAFLPNDDLQLDAWLEAQSGGNAPSPNGSAPHSPEHLVAIAQQYHAAVHTAEQQAVPDIPARRIWEDVMRTTAPIGTITVPGLGRNGATPPPPNSPHANAAEPPWAKPGHWLVPTLLCAAVLIGILAVYANFFGENSTPPPPTNAPGLAFGSPETEQNPPATPANIDEWLVDPSTFPCASPAADASTPAVNSLNAPTDLPMPLDQYLPLSTDVSAAEQRTIAERFQRWGSDCPATADDPVVSDSFSWMPGPSVAPATADQIATAQQVSAALPMQDYRDYFIIRPAGDETTSDRAVLLPQDVVQLPDGRLGAPLRQVIHSDSPDTAITELTQGYEMAPTMFMVFEQADGQWLYDELFQLCIGDCEAYWSMLAGDLPVPQTCDVAPLTLDEISRIEQAEFISAPAREYGPTSPVDESLANEISLANDQFDACYAEGEWRSVASLRLIQEATTVREPLQASMAVQGVTPGSASEEGIAFQQELATLFLTEPREAYVLEVNDARGDASLQRMEPEDVVQLADGRVGGPVTSYYPVGELDPPYAFSVIPVVVFSNDRQPDTWDVDELFMLCIGECEPYYDYLRTGEMPEATPSATPEGASQWLIDPDELDCTRTGVDPFPAEPALTAPGPMANYLPFGGPAAEGLRTQAATTFQQMQGGCSPPSADAAFVSPDLTIFGPVNENQTVTQQQLDTAMAIAAAIDTGNPLDWVIEGPALPADASEGGPMSSSRRVVLPESVITLPDGRLAAPTHLYMQTNHPDGIAGYIAPWNMVEIGVVVFDPTIPGTPVVELLTLCMGDCDQYWNQYVVVDASGTPVATPSAENGPQPITSGECVVEPISNDELTERIRNPGDARERSYEPIGLADEITAQRAAEVDREWLACGVFGSINQRSALQTDTLTSSGPEGPDGPGNEAMPIEEYTALMLDTFDARRGMGEMMFTGEWRDFVYRSESIGGADEVISTAPWPERAVLLADGRIAMPLVQFVWPDLWARTVENMTDPALAEISSLSIPINILAMDLETGTWLMDEVIWACAHNCDVARERLVESMDAVATTVAEQNPSPVATPAATPLNGAPGSTRRRSGSTSLRFRSRNAPTHTRQERAGMRLARTG